MSQNCNTIVTLPQEQYDAKAALAKSASAALLGAMSDAFRAAEVIDSGTVVERAAVYLTSATAKVDVASSALVRNEEILNLAPVESEALSWLRGLDFERLYADGVMSGAIQGNAGQWTELVEINSSQGYMGATRALRSKLSRLRDRMVSLASDVRGTLPQSNVQGNLVSLITELGNIGAFAQMVAYLNRIQPMDSRWSQPVMASSQA